MILPVLYSLIVFIFIKKNMVIQLSTLKMISYIYIVITLIGGLLHVIMLFADEIKGQFRIMIEAVFCLTECFNAFLMFVYLHTAQQYLGK